MTETASSHDDRSDGDPIASHEVPPARTATAMPPVADLATWQALLDELLVREKAHTREGDAIAAARRRLPMVEVDANTPVTGPNGPTTLLEVFEGRRQLFVYYHMWHDGHPAAEQCEGCTFCNGHVRELAYFHARDITYATFSEGPYDEGARYSEFLGLEAPWYSARPSVDVLTRGRGFGLLVCYLRDGDRVYETYWTTGRASEVMGSSYGLIDMTVYGRQELHEDSPEGWPKRWKNDGSQFRTDERPSAQWSRLAAGRSDDLSPAR